MTNVESQMTKECRMPKSELPFDKWNAPLDRGAVKIRVCALLLLAYFVANPGCVDPSALSPTDSAGQEQVDEGAASLDWETRWEGWVPFDEAAAGDESEMYARTIPEVAAVGDTITVEVVVGSSYGRPMSPVWIRMAEPAGDRFAEVDPTSGPEWVPMPITGGKITDLDGNLVDVQGDDRGDGDWGESRYAAKLTVPDGRTLLQFKVRAFNDEPEYAFAGWDVTAPRPGYSE
jgi:hypothetical protein